MLSRTTTSTSSSGTGRPPSPSSFASSTTACPTITRADSIASSITLGPTSSGLLPRQSFSLLRRPPNPAQTAERLMHIGYAPHIARQAAETHADPRRASQIAFHLAHTEAGERCHTCRVCADESRARWEEDDRDPLAEKKWKERGKNTDAWIKTTRKHMAAVDKQRKAQGLKGYYKDSDSSVSHLAPAHPGPAYARPQITNWMGSVAGLTVGLGGV